MAIEIKAIPTLEGKKASLFIKEMKKNREKKISSKKVAEIRAAAEKIIEKAKF